MKILSVALLLMASLAFVLVGCTDNAGPVASQHEEGVSTPGSAAALGKRGPVVNWATGNPGLFYMGKVVVSTCTARRYADGSSDGQYERWAHALDPTIGEKWHGRVLSLIVYDGNTAVIGGVETGQYGFPDTYDVFIMIDNGEGANADPDIRSAGIYWAFTRIDAERVWNLPPQDVVREIAKLWGSDESEVLIPLEMGNITVR